MKREEFDEMIGQLDRVISRMMVAAKTGNLDEIDWQTLKHHAEDVEAAGRRVLELYKEWKGVSASKAESPPSGQAPKAIDLQARRVDKATPQDQRHEYGLTVSFEGRDAECKTEGCKDFVLGYEAGMLHARLEARPENWTGTYHASNTDILGRVATAHQYDMHAEQSPDPTWVFVTFAPVARRLSVVPSSE